MVLTIACIIFSLLRISEAVLNTNGHEVKYIKPSTSVQSVSSGVLVDHKNDAKLLATPVVVINDDCKECPRISLPRLLRSSRSRRSNKKEVAASLQNIKSKTLSVEKHQPSTLGIRTYFLLFFIHLILFIKSS